MGGLFRSRYWFLPKTQKSNIHCPELANHSPDFNHFVKNKLPEMWCWSKSYDQVKGGGDWNNQLATAEKKEVTTERCIWVTLYKSHIQLSQQQQVLIR
jgi:hypothetical protein